MTILFVTSILCVFFSLIIYIFFQSKTLQLDLKQFVRKHYLAVRHQLSYKYILIKDLFM